ncbi:archaetidylserine decarboxylase [Comamonas sp. MYb21]|uniref:archaetidylserine decarboxylase n=1 Tax=Comamonas sp. MYb21 TaxID=1848648 RepID=UPI0030A935D2
MRDRIAVLPQYLLPKKWMTALAGTLASAELGGATTRFIRWFVGKYQVNMDEAAQPDIAQYKSFNDFFTRELRAGVRPMAQADLVCPVDGAISQCGAIAQDQIFQAKGHSYSTAALLGGDAQLAAQFNNGQFATIYLSPRDYHRIHMPLRAKLQKMVYVPGDLFSVNPLTARGVPGLFARNERVVCVFESRIGPVVMVLVGATIVGSMSTTWHGQVNPPRSRKIRSWDYQTQPIVLEQGDEMGRFLLGSTIVLLLPEGKSAFNADWAAAKPVQLGEAMGSFSR